MFNSGRIYVYRLDNDTHNISGINNTDIGITNNWVFMVEVEQRNNWAFPFVSGYTYDVWWNSGIDFTSVALVPSYYMTPDQ